MACGIDRACIEGKLRQSISNDGGDFEVIEKKLATQTGRAPDHKLDLSDVDQFVRTSGATSGSGFVHNRVVQGFMSALDRNGDKAITAAEWAQRQK